MCETDTVYARPYSDDVPFGVGQLVRFPDDHDPYRYKAFRDISVKFEKTHSNLLLGGVTYFHEIQGNIAMVIEERDPRTYVEKTHVGYFVRVLSSAGLVWVQRDHLVPVGIP